MAFCPHCGKSVTDQASKCLACGNEFEPRAKGARFKGTMMMSPGAAGPLPGRPATPAAGTEQPAAAAVPPPVAPAPAAQPAPRAPTPAPSKVGKHTMLGTGGAGLAPPRPSAQQAALPKAPPPAASVPAPVPAAPAPAAAVRPQAPADKSDLALAATTRPPAEPSASAASTEREDSKRFLVGDPMAPSGQTGGRAAARRSSDDPVIPGVNAPGTTGKLLGIAIGGIVVIALVGYLAARFMGLVN